ncbi:MAG: lipid-binding protein [Flavobacteriaceae bacterium CG2_30_34_30]|nr:YceI family protein [Flavobacteriia bacterium]OIP51815.1 MAG: lipid-binding protein [Flavobacteriaceae bacterium CG2_30_34_30]PIQ17337.1 MAG: lipid-binding protein [Flavobacteriaceae bacterium CG18_big_fil_WC_8_21_14_2_50_34_36]PIV49329.1 MAG: YceI family protein [Flavobacteriaceae bacterium CG02_land_8_20_14_3_00_34_13]PIZ06816.1 MAG: YceI family protein [Flavobacteriaceae bacterium CG_4_10_14_0_8_um_filter_34_31]PJC05944.1 MAG: YceI family protein [Flavobacteriaceae bacterium CG_4_9_14_0_
MKTNILKGIGATVIILTALAFTKPMEKEIKIKESSIIWVGEKITGSHTGTIQLKEGNLLMEGNQLIGGSFVIDMTTINVTDLTGENKGKLEGHLKSDDFFGVANFPTATLIIKNANKTTDGYYINAEITIKGKTEPIAFDLKLEANTATTSLKIDRTKFGVRYGSGSFFDSLGDNTIYDNFDLNVSLKF